MAFQNVNVSNTKKATAMAHGESLTGYIVRFEPGKAFEEGGEAPTNIVIRDSETQEDYVLFTAGNLKYMIRDGKIKVGLLTQITRLPDGKSGKMKSSQFQVQQDPEQTISDAVFAAIESVSAPSVASTSNIKAHAAKLQANLAKKA